MRGKYFDKWFENSKYKYNDDLYLWFRRNGGGGVFYRLNEFFIYLFEIFRNNISVFLRV